VCSGGEDLDPVPALRLCLVERSVGASDQSTSIGRKIREHRNAETGRDGEVLLEELDFGDRGANALEVIQIEQDRRQRPHHARRLRDQAVQDVLNGARVGQPRQGIGRGAELCDREVPQVGEDSSVGARRSFGPSSN
jgi:hypothetical protein